MTGELAGAWTLIAAGSALLSAGIGAVVALSTRRSVERVMVKVREGQRATELAVEHLATAVASSQAWFWTPEWQAGEREADEDLTAGRFDRYVSLDDMKTGLDAAAERYTSSSTGA
jgi:hypothetical protein